MFKFLFTMLFKANLKLIFNFKNYHILLVWSLSYQTEAKKGRIIHRIEEGHIQMETLQGLNVF